jgi:hypothetical protein
VPPNVQIFLGESVMIPCQHGGTNSNAHWKCLISAQYVVWRPRTTFIHFFAATSRRNYGSGQ